MAKIGRNEPCPCGSGIKYKRCHGDVTKDGRIERAFQSAATHMERFKALEHERKVRQGLGKPIISTEVAGHRVVAVGNTIHFGKRWKTFPDFLMDFIKKTLGEEWGTAELQKPENEMHPVLFWHRKTAVLQAAHAGKPGDIFSSPETGAVRSYLELAYNLYLLEHNEELRKVLIGRLKHPDQFLGALSEIRVAGMLIRAGFSVKFHDEADGSKTHCEYDARRTATGKTFSVEVKTRHWGKFPANDDDGRRAVRRNVRKLVRLALAKEAEHERLIFIELAMPDEPTDDGKPLEPWWMQAAVDGVKEAAQSLQKKGKDVPPALVIVGNHAHHFQLDSTKSVVGYALEGIGATEVHGGMKGTVREALRFREKHADLLALWKSIEAHRHIPQTFDGQSHRLAYGDHPPRLLVGNRYSVPGASGAMVEAVLEDAVVLPSEKSVYGIYRTDAGERVVCTNQLTDAEAQAYAEQPDTFFGVIKRQSGINDPLELFDFFFESYGKSPKETLLRLMADRADISSLQALSQRELAEIYCEGAVYAVLASQERSAKRQVVPNQALPKGTDFVEEA